MFWQSWIILPPPVLSQFNASIGQCSTASWEHHQEAHLPMTKLCISQVLSRMLSSSLALIFLPIYRSRLTDLVSGVSGLGGVSQVAGCSPLFPAVFFSTLLGSGNSEVTSQGWQRFSHVLFFTVDAYAWMVKRIVLQAGRAE